MDRVCPSCNENLGVIGDYFCYKCGVKLPAHLTTDEVRVKSGSSLIPPPFIIIEEVSKDFFKHLFSLFLFFVSLVLIGIAAFLLISYSVNQKNKVVVKPNTVVNDKIIKSDVDLPSATFGSSGLVSLVPSDADILVEGTNISKAIYAFTKAISSTAIPNINLKVSDINNLVEDSYVIFSKTRLVENKESRVWGFIFKSRNNEALKSAIESAKSATWYAQLVDSYLVVSNDKATFDEVEKAKNKVVLNLSLNSRYATAKNSLPGNGKLFVLIFTNSAYSSLKTFESTGLFSPKFKEFIDTMIKMNKNSYVVQ